MSHARSMWRIKHANNSWSNESGYSMTQRSGSKAINLLKGKLAKALKRFTVTDSEMYAYEKDSYERKNSHIWKRDYYAAYEVLQNVELVKTKHIYTLAIEWIIPFTSQSTDICVADLNQFCLNLKILNHARN